MADVKLNIVTATNLQGLNQLKAKLQEVSKSAQSVDGAMVGTYSAAEIQKTIRAVNTLERALTMAYDKKLNTVNVQKFNQYLAKSNLTIKDLYTHLSRLGTEGQQAFIKMSQTALTMGRSIKKTNKLVTEMKTTMINTFRWGISSGLWNTMLSSVSKAFTYVKGLDKDLNNIRIVTGKSADQMERFAKTANKAAKDLAVSTRDYTQGALIYYQQGDDDETVAKKTEVTAKAANVTGQDMSAVSEQLTAVWNGYQVANQAAKEGMQVYEEYVDKMAAVGAETASDLEELATAMSKVASAAHSMGVDFDQLNAQISTIVSVTRQAPESVGTALKTIYARLGDLKVDGVDEFGTKLGEVSSQLKTMGIDVVDSNGQMREMGTVMTEVASKWDGWTSSQKQAAAVAMAGKRQYNNLIALFDNWDMYSESLETSMGATGTLTEQQGIAVESLDKKMQRLSTAGEKMYDALFDEKSIGGLIDGLTVIVDLIGSAVEGVGGLSTILPVVGGMLLKSFGGNIANSFATGIENEKIRNAEMDNDKAKMRLANELGEQSSAILKENPLVAKEQEALVEYYKEMSKYRANMTDEEIVAFNQAMERKAALIEEKIQTQETLNLLKKKNVLTEEQYKILEKINNNEEISEEEEKEIQKTKEENDLRINGYKALQEATITENLAGYNDQEAVNADLAERAKKRAAHASRITGITGDKTGTGNEKEEQDRILTNTLETAAREGATVEEAIDRVKKRMEELNIEPDEGMLNEFTDAYVGMARDVEEVNKSLSDDFESTIGVQLRESLGEEGGEAVDDLKKKVIELQKQGYTLQNAYIKAMEQIKEESEDTAEVLQNVEVQSIEQEDIDAEMQAIQETQELKEGIEGLSNATGGAMQVFGGLTGIINSFSSAMDPSLDSGERLKAVITGLIVSIPLLTNGIASTVSGLKQFTNFMKTSNAVTELKTFVINKLRTALGLKTAATAVDSAGNVIHSGTENADTAAVEANTIAKIANKIASLGLAGAVLLAVAAIAAVTIAIITEQEALEEEKRAARENAKAKRELANAAKEEKEAIDAIVDSYKSLQEQYEDDSLTLSELQTKVADLCIEYGRQDLALKALIADYKELNDIMDEAQNEANEDYIEKGEVSIKADKTAIVKTIMSDADSTITDEVNGKDALDIVDGIFANSGEEQIQVLLAKYGVETVDGHVYTDQFVDAITKHYDEIYSALGEIDEDAAKDLMEVMDLVADDVKETKGTFDAVSETKKATISKNYNNRDIETFQEYSNAIDEMTKEVEQYFDSVEDAKAWAESQLISNQDNKRFALINDLAKKQAEAIGGEGAEVTDEIVKQLEGLSLEELSFASKYFDMKAIDETFEMFAAKYSDFITYLNKENQIVPTIEFILNDADAKEVTKEQLDSLFSTDDFSEAMNITKEQFEALDFDKQRLMMSQYFVDYQKYLTENKDAIVKSIEETAKELDNIDIKFEGEDKNWFTKEGDIDFIKTQYGDTFNSILDELGMSYDQLAVALEKYYVNEETLTETEKKLIAELEAELDAATNKELLVNFDGMYGYEIEEAYGEKIGSILEEAHWSYEDLVNVLGSSEKTEGEQKVLDEIAAALGKTTKLNFKDMGKAISLNKRYQAQVEATTAALKKAKEGEADYAGALAAVRGQYPLINEGIDNIQEGFSTLSSIVEDFNNDGTLSLDSLQTLLTMSEDMLACLELENGQMTINGDKMKEMTLARLEQAKATIWQETQTGLLAIVTGETAEAENNAAYQAFMLAETVTKGAAAAQESGEEWLKYNAIVAGVDLSSIYNNPQALEFMEQQRIKMQALETTAEGIENSDFTLVSGDERNEELKFFEDEFDRYWKLNKIIDKTSQAIDKLSDAQDGLFRQELLDNIDSTNKALEQQIQNYENLAKAQQQEVSELQSSLSGYGVSFDAEGGIANYAEAAQNALNYYNNVVERYNKGLVDDAGLETAEESYDKFKEQLERYDELYYDEMVDTAEQIAEKQAEILENNLKKFELELEIKTNAQDFEREINDFFAEINTDFKSSFEDVGASIEKAKTNAMSFGESFSTMNWGINQVKEEINKLYNGQKSDTFSSLSEAQEKLKELTQEAMSYASDMQAAYEEAWEAYLEGITQSEEKFDNIQEQYDNINAELEYQQQLVELIYGPEAYDLMDKFYKQQGTNMLSNITSLQAEKEMWEKRYEAAEEGSQEQAQIQERINNLQSSLNEKTTEYVQLLKDEYANTISGILSNFESQLTNGSSLDDIAEEWERLTENSDKYFNNVEGLYETQTLANKIKDSINDTISVKNQEKLQALYDREIEYLREKENLTQYDLDAAEARYQIALKEIALEEARENKNAMKLMRDANGNWSYQYVANEDNIAEKQQELSDAMYKFYELSDKAYQENLESIQKLNQEYFDKAEEIATNELLTEQEKELKLEELRKWYLNQYQLLVSENEIIRQNLANGTVGVLNNLYNQDAENFENMTLQEQAALTQVKELGITSFAELEDKARQNIEGIGSSINIVAEQNIPEMTSKTQELADTWGADDGASVKAQSLDALNSMIETSEQYQITLSEVAAAVKEDWGENGIAGAISNASQYVIDLEEATKNLCNNTKTNLATYKDNVDKISTSWGNVKAAIEDSIEQLNTLYELQGNPPPKATIPGGAAVQGREGGFADIPGSASIGGGKKSDNPPNKNSSIVGYLFGADLQASQGGSRKYDLDNGKEYSVKAYEYVDYGKSYAPYPIRVKLADDREGYVAPGSLYGLSWGKNGVPYRGKLINTFGKVGSFDTGGYTGEWGSDGRIAMLHEKELVLNKEDTSNILAAVNGIRQFSSIESAISKKIASMIMNMTGMGVNVNYNTNEAKGNQTEPVFNITAEFPNANNVSEIREAILSLPGLASQQVGLNLI